MLKGLERVFHYIIHGIPIKKTFVNVSQLSSSDKLKGKNILITGGGRGLGFYIAKKCLYEGANVLITGRSEENLCVASKELDDCKYIVFDLSNIHGVHNLIEQCALQFDGRIDCLINNAGISLHEGNIKRVTIEGFENQLNINLKAPYFLSQAFIKHCEEVGNYNASILFVSSERGLYCDDMPYGLIKASINSLTRGLSRRLIKEGIRVNAVAPGVTASDMTGYKRDSDLYREKACGERVFLPEEVAETVTFLISDAAKCISGEIISCNQGNHLRCDW